MATKTKSKGTKRTRTPASIVWFDVPADDIQRARSFYNKLFGWKITSFPGTKHDYWHIDTGGADASPDGGIMPRQHPEHTITNYVMVDSVDKAAAKVQKLGGEICLEKTPVQQMGYFIICKDTEGNAFALWERNEKAK
jgi:predicted enzyme related to lactoylglutathione lyase